MSEHLDSDTLATIGAALRWNLPEALLHLEECDDCRAQLEEMRLVRASFLEEEPVDPAVLARISTAVSSAARDEQRHHERRSALLHAIEPLVAGVAALIILGSSGIRITSLAAALLGFLLGAALMMGGRILARGIPALRLTYGDS